MRQQILTGYRKVKATIMYIKISRTMSCRLGFNYYPVHAQDDHFEAKKLEKEPGNSEYVISTGECLDAHFYICGNVTP